MPDTLSSTIVEPDVIQFHVLTTFPPHNVNRDEDGRPKTFRFGDSLRGRISSQAKKRALRFAPHFPGNQRATRTREAGIVCFRRLIATGIDTVSATWAALTVNFAIGVGGEPPKWDTAEAFVAPSPKKHKKLFEDRQKKIEEVRKSGITDQETLERRALEMALRTEQGLVVSKREFSRIDESMAMLEAAWRDDPETFPEILEKWVKTVCKDKLLIDADHDLDTALFGRMVATEPAFNVEAACAVSHAFTTHTFLPEGDFFSAGEELNALGGTGAAITSYAFFGGGVYYLHAALDRGHLRTTLSQGRTEEEADRLTRDAVDSFFEGLVFAQPKGKRNSFASDVAANYVLVTRGSDPTLNLGFAFLDPVTATREADILRTSIDRLKSFHDVLRESYGLRNRIRIFNGYPPARAQNQPQGDEVWQVEDLRRFVLEPET